MRPTASVGNVPSGPAGGGSGLDVGPGTVCPATPFTDSVEYAKVSMRERDQVAVDVERMVVVVLERVAGQVVARVELLTRPCRPRSRPAAAVLTSSAPVKRPPEGMPAVDERLVVAASVEGRVVVRLADLRVVGLVEILDRR